MHTSLLVHLSVCSCLVCFLCAIPRREKENKTTNSNHVPRLYFAVPNLKHTNIRMRLQNLTVQEKSARGHNHLLLLPSLPPSSLTRFWSFTALPQVLSAIGCYILSGQVLFIYGPLKNVSIVWRFGTKETNGIHQQCCDANRSPLWEVYIQRKVKCHRQLDVQDRCSLLGVSPRQKVFLRRSSHPPGVLLKSIKRKLTLVVAPK